MKTYLLLAAFALTPFAMQAQFGKLLNKAKDKVTQRAEGRLDTEMDKTLDKVEGKGAATPGGSATQNAPVQKGKEPGAATPPTVKAYSKFDFVPGDKIIYAEDFAQDAVGEMAADWNTTGKGEVMKLQGQPGKWLKMVGNTAYLTGNRKDFGENYTIEFDLLYFFEPKVKGYLLPGWKLRLFSSGKEDGRGNKFLKGLNLTMAEADFNVSTYANAKLMTRINGIQDFESDKMELGDATKELNTVAHYAVQVQKTRLRMWVNGSKIFDLPRALPASDTMNQIHFRLEGSNYTDEEVGLFISNVKIATGAPDARRKLMEEGRWSTTGILFDVSAATIRPESAGTLKEVAVALKENGSIKMKIVGHTDNDGADATNLELSKKRAEAVKAALVSDFGIEESRITTDGKGEAVPVGDNKTKEGKAQNRRVEFVKV